MQNRKLGNFEENTRISREFESNLIVLPRKKHRKFILCGRNHINMLILPYEDILEAGVALRVSYIADIHSADPSGRV